MRRDQPITPFDVEADDMTQQFWGASKGWVSSEQATVHRRAERPPAEARRSDDTTGSLRVIRDGFAAFRPQTTATATGETTRQRQHGAPRRRAADDARPERHEATLGELAAGRTDLGGRPDDESPLAVATEPRGRQDARAHADPEYDVPLTPAPPLAERLGLGAVDPLLLRAGVLVLVVLLLVPVMLSLRPERGDSLPGEVVEAPQPVVAGAAPALADTVATASAAPTGTSAAVPSTVSPVVAATEAVATSPSAPSSTAADTAPAVSDASAETASTGVIALATSDGPRIGDDAAAVDVVAERVVPVCPQKYTAAPGDSWYRIAEGAGVTPSRLLAENNATTETVIFPGDDICLPEGAAMPSPPVAPSTSEPAADEPTPTAPAPTTVAPATTPTPTTPPVANLSPDQVQELIRQTWPEDQVDKALDVARRESKFSATADNGWCCAGVFQIYWTVHQGWLDDFGITKRSDLFDARKNIAAAYHMWQSQGWGPWGG